MVEGLGRIGFGLFGLVVLIGIAWLFSNNKRAVDWRLVVTGIALQIAFAAVVLLVAIIAAVALTLRRRKDTKAIDPGQAVRVKRNDRLKIVKVETVNQRAIDAANVEKAAAAAAAAAAEPKEPK